MEIEKLFVGGVVLLLAIGVINANLPGKRKKAAEENAEEKPAEEQVEEEQAEEEAKTEE